MSRAHWPEEAPPIYAILQLSYGHAMTRMEASACEPFAQRSLDAGALRHDSSQSISYLLEAPAKRW